MSADERLQGRTIAQYFGAGIGISLGFMAIGAVMKLIGLEAQGNCDRIPEHEPYARVCPENEEGLDVEV